MKIFVPKETWPGETRVPLIPDTVKKLAGLGAEVEVEAGLNRPFLKKTNNEVSHET